MGFRVRIYRSRLRSFWTSSQANNLLRALPQNGHPPVAPRACDFFDFSCLSTPTQMFSTPPQSCHPERSASRICRVTEGLIARSRRTPAMLIGRMLFEAFRPQTTKLRGRLNELQLRLKWRDLRFCGLLPARQPSAPTDLSSRPKRSTTLQC